MTDFSYQEQIARAAAESNDDAVVHADDDYWEDEDEKEETVPASAKGKQRAPDTATVLTAVRVIMT